jgi:serine/threonine protein kinase
LLPAAEHPPPAVLDRLAHECELRNELDAAWAALPLELVTERGRIALLIADPGGEPLERLTGEPMEVGRFLRLAIGIVAALGKMHQRGLVHKDIKPANILVYCADGQTRLTGFGIASRLSHERQASEAPEFIAGTLAYMAPEQTGRINRNRLPQRSLRTRRYLLSDADRLASVQRCRRHGMGSLPHRETADPAGRPVAIGPCSNL